MLEESVSQHYNNEPQRLVVLTELMSKVNNCQGRQTKLLSGNDFAGLGDLEQVTDVDLVDGVYEVSASSSANSSDSANGSVSIVNVTNFRDVANVVDVADIKAITSEITNEVAKEVTNEVTKSPYLLVGMGNSYKLGYGQTRIGRLESNDIVINDNFISRHHAVIVVHSSNKVEIFESSRNGTRVNDIDIVHSFLKLNDEIVIGPRRCNYKFVLSKVVDNKNFSSDNTNASFVRDASFDNNKVSENSENSSVDEDRKEYLPLTVTSKRLNVEVKPNKSQKVRRPNNSRSNSKSIVAGFSLIELLVVIVTAGILAAISIPNLLTTKRSANSASAVQSLRLISSSQAAYSTGVGSGEYATVDDLVREEFIDSSIAAASIPSSSPTQQPKSGYIFVFNKISANPSTNALPSYEVSARPLFTNGLTASGNKSFFVDSSAVIRVSPSPTPPFADANSQPLN
ncbi:MAG: FHA domain-containing protein [Blastocatellia bacterium]